MWHEKKNCQRFRWNKCQQPHTDDSYDGGFSVGQQDNTENSVYHWRGTGDMKQKQSQKIIYYGVPKTPYCSWHQAVQPCY